MKIRVRLSGGIRNIEVTRKATVASVLKHLGINQETVLIKRGREIITEEEILLPNDEIEVIKVVSGG